MPTMKVSTMTMMIQTDELTSVQNSKSTHIAEISAGIESQLP